MLNIIPLLLVVAAAIGGLSIVIYIRYKKGRPEEAMVCPLGSDCHSVIYSEYSKFFGIPLELFGMGYYGLIALTYITYIVRPDLSSLLSPYVFPLTAGAVLFSAYLTFIQGFTLREWCTWCLSSAALSTLIFLLALGTTDFVPIQEFLIWAKPALTGFHILGLALGLGAATVGDIFFFKFLRDLRISQREADTLRTISQVVWFGIGLLVISGAGIFLTDPVLYGTSAKFLVKVFVVAVIIANGAFLNLFVTPRLIHISFGDPHKHIPGELHHERGLAFTSGAISGVSWYTAFILGLLSSSPVPYWMLLIAYFVALVGAIFIANRAEATIAARGHDGSGSANSNSSAPTSNAAK